MSSDFAADCIHALLLPEITALIKNREFMSSGLNRGNPNAQFFQRISTPVSGTRTSRRSRGSSIPRPDCRGEAPRLARFLHGSRRPLELHGNRMVVRFKVLRP